MVYTDDAPRNQGPTVWCVYEPVLVTDNHGNVVTNPLDAARHCLVSRTDFNSLNPTTTPASVLISGHRMAEKADDLYLPNAVLLRIIRESLPERTIVSREARSAISKSASSFILYVTSLASVHCEKSKRKTLTGNDILAALKEMEFGHFIPALNTFLEKYREQTTAKKTHKRLYSEIDDGKTSNQLIKNLPASSSSLVASSSSSASSTVIPNSKLLSDNNVINTTNNNVVSLSEIEEENIDEADPNDEDITDDEDQDEEEAEDADGMEVDVEGEEALEVEDEVEPDEDVHFNEKNVDHADQVVIVIGDDDNSSQKTEALKENDDSV
uniref:DNA polymerase epsilon subunit 3 n=1 Tax=Trichobilharzia regenti TaxID=157069 RepID=A0AA85ITU8_TRIRE|nr:unnamed protein product [Trichobilharzia regenti]